MPNTIQLPQSLYDALQQEAQSQQTTTDALVIEWVAAHLGTAANTADTKLTALGREEAAFERLKPTLLKTHLGQFVAIYQGRVVASGEDKFVVLDEVRRDWGNVICFVEKVADW